MTGNIAESPNSTQNMKTGKEEFVNGGGMETITNSDVKGETKMTKAKWLACFALGLSYTTAFQQGNQ
jgi:hypothetical protein